MIVRRLLLASPIVSLLVSGCVLNSKVGKNDSAINGTGGAAGAAGSGGITATGGSANGGSSGGGGSAAGGAGGSGGSGTGGASSCAFESPFLSPPTTLASGQVNPEALAVDATNVYWIQRSIDFTNGGSLMKMSKAGGQPVTLASVAMYPSLSDHAFDDVVGLVVSATHAYWRAAQGHEVWRVPLAGGTPEPIFTGTSAQDNSDFLTGDNGVHNIAVDATHVYWTYYTTITDQSVYAAPIGGGSAAPIAGSATNTHPTSVVADASGVYWSTYGTYPMGFLDGGVMGADAGGVNVHSVASNFGSAEMLALDTTGIYVTGWEVDVARKIPLPAASAPVELNPTAGASRSIAVDDTFAYVTVDYAQDCHGILRMPKVPSTAPPIPLVMSANFHAFTIAVDDQDVYWIDETASQISKMSK